MKHSTAVAKALRLAERVRRLGGIIATPMCDHEACKITAIWLFGSTAKGKENPNDVDILVDWKCVQHRPFRAKSGRNNFRIDRWHKRTYGTVLPMSSSEEALKFLKRHIPMVSLHALHVDGDIAYPRIMLYPRNELKEKIIHVIDTGRALAESIRRENARAPL